MASVRSPLVHTKISRDKFFDYLDEKRSMLIHLPVFRKTDHAQTVPHVHKLGKGKAGETVIDLVPTTGAWAPLIVCQTEDDRYRFIKKAISQVFPLTGAGDHGFGYRATAFKAEDKFGDPDSPLDPLVHWVIIMQSDNVWDDLKESIRAFYTTRGQIPTKAIKPTPNYLDARAALVPGNADVSSPDTNMKIDPFIGPETITLRRMTLQGNGAEKLAYMAKMSPTKDGILRNVQFPLFSRDDCKICHQFVTDTVVYREWFDPKCDQCPGTSSAAAEESPDRCLPCVIKIRSQRLDMRVEPFKRDQFMCDWSEVLEEFGNNLSISTFAKGLEQQLDSTNLCVASTMTIIALYKQYTFYVMGEENAPESFKALDRVDEGEKSKDYAPLAYEIKRELQRRKAHEDPVKKRDKRSKKPKVPVMPLNDQDVEMHDAGTAAKEAEISIDDVDAMAERLSLALTIDRIWGDDGMPLSGGD